MESFAQSAEYRRQKFPFQHKGGTAKTVQVQLDFSSEGTRKKVLLWFALILMILFSFEFLAVLIVPVINPDVAISPMTIVVTLVLGGLCIWGTIACITRIVKDSKEKKNVLPVRKLKTKQGGKKIFLLVVIVCLIVGLFNGMRAILAIIARIGTGKVSHLA